MTEQASHRRYAAGLDVITRYVPWAVVVGLLAWVATLGGVKNRPLAEVLLLIAALCAFLRLVAYDNVRRLPQRRKVLAWLVIAMIVCTLWLVARNNLLPEDEPPLAEQIAEVVEKSVGKAMANSKVPSPPPPAPQEPNPTTAAPVTAPPVVIPTPAPSPQSDQPTKEEEPPPVVEPPPPPDVALRFIRPKSLAVYVVNIGKSVVREARYSVVVWNLDSEDGPAVLPIPVKGFKGDDWIRPGEALGPYGVASLENVNKMLNQGDRIFGYAGVSCPDCIEHRWYWLSLVHGEYGWYSELEPGFHPSLSKLASLIPQARDNLEHFVRTIPPEKRLIIRME